MNKLNRKQLTEGSDATQQRVEKLFAELTTMQGYGQVMLLDKPDVLDELRLDAAQREELQQLTRNFLDEHFPGADLSQVLLAAPEALEPIWVDRLSEGLGSAAAPLAARHLPPLQVELALGSQPVWREIAPMLGAARREVL